MSKPTKLTENDFDYIHWNKDSCGIDLFQLIIYGKSESNCDKIKQQILKNQEIVKKLESKINEVVDQSVDCDDRLSNREYSDSKEHQALVNQHYALESEIKIYSAILNKCKLQETNHNDL